MSRHHRSASSSQWAQTRRIVLDRDGYRCQQCGGARQLEVDHIEPLHRQPDQPFHDIDGLQTLCAWCHQAKTRDENRELMRPERAEWYDLLEDLFG